MKKYGGVKNMFKKLYAIVELETRSDKRGSLFEILRFKDNNVSGEGQLYTFTINPGQRRGDHYHEKKEEWFSCVYGEAVILLEDEFGNKKKVILKHTEPKIIYCGEKTIHALYNEKETPSVIVSYGSHQHDPDDPDTFFKFIDYD